MFNKVNFVQLLKQCGRFGYGGEKQRMELLRSTIRRILHFTVGKGRVADPCRKIGDTADPAYPHPGVYGGDRFAGGAHADGVRTQQTEHPNLLGRLIIRTARL